MKCLTSVTEMDLHRFVVVEKRKKNEKLRLSIKIIFFVSFSFVVFKVFSLKHFLSIVKYAKLYLLLCIFFLFRCVAILHLTDAPLRERVKVIAVWNAAQWIPPILWISLHTISAINMEYYL